MYRLDSLSLLDNYYNWIFQEFKPFFGRRILEVGAGVGTFTRTYAGMEGIEKIYLLEPYYELLNELQRTFEKDQRIDNIHSRAEDLTINQIRDMNVDTIIMVNVLEHIADDALLLKTFFDGLLPGGNVLLFCPAFQLLFSHIDATAGHHRRYTKKTISEKLEAAGFNVAYKRYFNFTGFFSWFLYAKLLKADDFNKKGLKVYNNLIPYMKWIEDILRPPLGQSVIVVGESKKGDRAGA